MRILWVEDEDYSDIKTSLSLGVVQKKKTIAEALGYIDNSFDKFDAVFLDIDLTGDGDVATDMEAIKGSLEINDSLNYFSLNDGNDLRKKGGFIIYNHLIEKGFPKGRIVFLTGNADKNNIADTELIDNAVAEVTELIDDNHKLSITDEKIKEWLGVISSGYSDISEKYKPFANKLKSEKNAAVWLKVLLIGLKVLYHKNLIQEYWEMILQLDDNQHDLLECWIKTTNNYFENLNKLDVPSNTYEEFEQHFKDALTSLPKAISKSARDVNDQIEKKIETINSNHYLTLRRGIIDACDELTDTNLFNVALKATPNKEEAEEAFKREIKDKLTELRAMLPLIEPKNENKRRLLKRMARAIVHDWESYDASKASFGWLLRTARNWLAHGNGHLEIKIKEKDVAFLFILHIRSVFKDSPNDYSTIENMLLSLFNPIPKELVYSSVDEEVISSYYTMYKMYEFIKDKCGKCKYARDTMEFLRFTSSCREHLEKKGHKQNFPEEPEEDTTYYDTGKTMLGKGMTLIYQSFFHVVCEPESKRCVLHEPKRPSENGCNVLEWGIKLTNAKDVMSPKQTLDDTWPNSYHKLACAFLNCADFSKLENSGEK